MLLLPAVEFGSSPHTRRNLDSQSSQYKMSISVVPIGTYFIYRFNDFSLRRTLAGPHKGATRRFAFHSRTSRVASQWSSLGFIISTSQRKLTSLPVFFFLTTGQNIVRMTIRRSDCYAVSLGKGVPGRNGFRAVFYEFRLSGAYWAFRRCSNVGHYWGKYLVFGTGLLQA